MIAFLGELIPRGTVLRGLSEETHGLLVPQTEPVGKKYTFSFLKMIGIHGGGGFLRFCQVALSPHSSSSSCFLVSSMQTYNPIKYQLTLQHLLLPQGNLLLAPSACNTLESHSLHVGVVGRIPWDEFHSLLMLYRHLFPFLL